MSLMCRLEGKLLCLGDSLAFARCLYLSLDRFNLNRVG